MCPFHLRSEPFILPRQDLSNTDPDSEDQAPDQGYFSSALSHSGGVPIPQLPTGSSANQPPSSWPQAYTAPYTAAMQMERSATSRLRRDPSSYSDVPPPLHQSYPTGSPSRPRRPNMQELASGTSGGAGASSSSSSQGPNQPQPGAPRDFYFAQQQTQQPSYRGNFGNYPQYPPQMPYNIPGNLPPGSIPHPDPHGHPSYPPMYHSQYYRQDPNFNPFPPPMYSRDRESPYWPTPMEGDSFSRNVAHHPQHSSSHGNAESFRFIRQINNNDVLCGRGGATNSHVGNRSFRQIVKQYKDKYLNAKKKEKPNVAGEIVEKIRSLDPPGRFLKKDRDTGYWLDIGDMRAKEKTSQALREGAPLIRKKMKEEQLQGLSATDEEGGASDTISPEKSVTSAVQDAADDEGKRKMLSMMLLRNEEISEEKDDEKSIPPPPKRQKSEDTEKVASSISTKQKTDDKDDDNASKKSEDLGTSKKGNDDDTKVSSDPKQQEADFQEDDKTTNEGVKEKETTEMSNVDEKDLTADQRDLYLNAFDPPRGVKKEDSGDEKSK